MFWLKNRLFFFFGISETVRDADRGYVTAVILSCCKVGQIRARKLFFRKFDGPPLTAATVYGSETWDSETAGKALQKGVKSL